MKICKSCNFNKLETEYYSYKYSIDKLRYICKDCCKKEQSLKQKNNPIEQKIYAKRWVENNREFINKYSRNRRASDPLFKIQNNLRRRLNHSLKAKKWYKNTHFSEYIGCDQGELKIHLEIQFTTGMTWENQGMFGWHIDHIIPLSSAKTEEELYKLCHYTNLQPLWAIDNIRKSNKLLKYDI